MIFENDNFVWCFFSKGKRKNDANKVKSNEDENMQEYVLSAQTGRGTAEKVER